MRFLKDMTIGARILAGYAVVLAMMLGLGVFFALRTAAPGAGLAVTAVALAVGGGVAFAAWRDVKTIMARVAEGIEASARAVAGAAADITSISRSLSANAASQAATVEETSAALEEISAVSRETAELTRGSEQLMNANIEKSGQSLKALVELTRNMGRIEEDSGKIRKIIAAIDAIAFQTNLLALNAAVEAARAGEAGAGFAVVADEVKNLANRAAEAAKNTQVLLDNTVNQVTSSAESLKQVNADFDDIVTTATRIGDKTAAITEASRQQSKGISEIAQAANEIDRVTQSLAAEAQNAAGAAELLTGQAEEIGVMVNHLSRLVFGKKRKPAAIVATRADVRCWEMKNCPPERRDSCPAYPDSGNACWTVTGTMCGGKQQGSYHEKIENCKKCDVFAAAHGQGGETAAASAVRCWEVKDCPPGRRDSCPAYPDNGNACWTVTGTMCGGKQQGSYHEKIENCKKCDVYRMVRGGTGPAPLQLPMVH